MSLSSDLVELIRDKSWSEAELERTSMLFLDTLATAYAGAATATGRKLVAWAKKEPLNSRSTTFLVAALAHITETDDLHRASASHPGCIVVPCIISLAQQLQTADRQVLIAALHGYEAMCRVGNALGPAHYRVWHNTATCGPFGSAFAAAQLLELSSKQTVDALGNAGTQSSGLWEFLQSGAMSKHLHAGRASEAGLLAAQLAAHDFTGAATILEGEKGFFTGLCPDPEPEQVLLEPNAAWQLMQTSVKPWPSCRHTHPCISAALEVHANLGNKLIESVQVETYDAAIDICDRAEAQSEYQAKFSLQHCAARALMDGQVAMDSFDERARGEVRELCQRISVGSSDPYKSNYPHAWGARVSVLTTDGAELSASREECKGDPELPLDREQMLDKAGMLLDFAGIGRAQADQICSKVLAMPESNSVCDLIDDFLQTVF